MKKKTKLDLLKELDNYKTFGIQLKEGMEEKGYSRQRLSEELSSKKLYVSEKDVDNWLKDKIYPDITTIYLICEMLELNPNDLLLAKQLMQEAGLGSINMQLIRVVCGVLNKSLVFSYWIVRTLFFTGLVIALGASWEGVADAYGISVVTALGKIIVYTIIAVLAGVANYYWML